ncbi:SGNH/GDSL hydrolase family protein [Alicyclobacillus dauci]|uniref:SGNH/GDSL hydrolase family protein n=1 Tax=Alicyclobacillus dauci TaxID=1475485 RepID=A0ABY6YYX8_9BACL|nr:SGNH/GDSL hydrolase family protein [Alicyclobacillus dauci]WAH35835.1 SGNH/GDSL hydrolase family protein [Alicyclobacillus dauci]
MHFVTLGDSITYGEGASRPWRSYPNVLAALFNRSMHRARSYGDILAQPGWTSADLRSAVVNSGNAVLSTSSAIVIWVGGDDLAAGALAVTRGAGQPAQLIAACIRRYALNLGQLLLYVRRVSRAPVYVCTQYNPFPNSALAEQGISALNSATAQVARRAGVRCVDSAAWFAGRQRELIAGYRTGTLRDALRSPLPIHPSDAGHRVIAQGLYGVIAPNIHM